MSLPAIIRRLADRDFDRSERWYERKRTGLGQRLRERIDDVFKIIEHNPYLFALDRYDVRHAKTKRFQYVIHYRIRIHYVEILAVLHAKRKSSLWMNRAKP